VVEAQVVIGHHILLASSSNVHLSHLLCNGLLSLRLGHGRFIVAYELGTAEWS